MGGRGGEAEKTNDAAEAPTAPIRAQERKQSQANASTQVGANRSRTQQKVAEPAPEVIVTNHAYDRVRERVGLPKRAVERLARTAMQRGRTSDEFNGFMALYLDRVQDRHNPDAVVKVFRGYMWLFCDNRLLTVIQIPKDLRRVIE